MKPLIICLLGALVVLPAGAQLKTTPVCPGVYVDLLDGTVNGLEPDFTAGQIKKSLPCFTAEEPESATSRCGGLIAYRDRDIYFYTGRNYVEIGPRFKGKLSLPLMGASRNSLFKWLGHPRIRDVNWDAFQTQYGILILYYRGGRVNRIQFSTESTESIRLCE
ncbi:MAG TPA: hypothetical protein VEB63_01470 [Chitinophagaceae bacterium]|nr:hypothetical protein [Chitinophagaceae bacterium]